MFLTGAHRGVAANAAAVRVADASPAATAPADLLNKLNKRVRLKLKRKRFAAVLKRLGLTTGGRRKKKTKRK
jgi:hypothetical protein